LTGRRVTLVIHGLGMGGAERLLAFMATWLHERGWEIHVVTLGSDRPDAVGLPPGSSRSDVPRAGKWFHVVRQLRRFWKLRSAISAGHPDVVFCMMGGPGLLVLMALLGSRIPVVISEQVDLQLDHTELAVSWRLRLLRALLYPTAKHIVLCADRDQAWAAKHFPRWRTTVLPNPLVFDPPGPGAEAPPWLAHPCMLAMGRFVPQKGFDLLVSAFVLLADRFPEWNLVIVGDGDLRPSLSAQVEAADLADRVRLPGLVPSPEPALAAADIFVLPSRFEGFPTVLGEAMACGVAVVAFDCFSGPAKFIRQGTDGLLVPPGDVTALADALGQVMASAELRERLGKDATSVVDRFSPAVIMPQWEEILLAASRTGHRR
jgi:GalNAc-alpha-(1->4)-GalNAc-alpha-(1->3)-diNAcBac-PP-undecaprenol alpha-1,4-N-acetyl-D-galactosaminyltransferase